jgi:DNA-binding SARP family transcriptional activator
VSVAQVPREVQMAAGDGGHARARVQVLLVGTFALSRDGTPMAGPDLGSRKARTLLMLLAVERARTVSAERIIEVLWGAAPPANPAENIATLVSRLRRLLGGQVISGGRYGYRLGSPPAVDVDLDEAARWAQEAERRLAAAEPALAVAAVARARELVAAGGVLDDEPAAEWAGPARDEPAELTRRTRRILGEAALAMGDAATVIAAAAEAVSEDPYDESARRTLMRGYAAGGEPARALAAYAELRDVLQTELGADPAAQTQELYLAVLRDQELPAGHRSPAARRDRDEPGLAGRLDELGRLRAAWHAAAAGAPALVIVSGEAGIGKTRLAAELTEIAAATSGTVLAARCYETERSLFLQPFVDAIAQFIRTTAPAIVRQAAGEHAPTLSRLLPGTEEILGRPAATRAGSADIERRRCGRTAQPQPRRGPPGR